MNLNFSGVPAKMEPTKGRMLDHIGFEVTDLQAFCKRLAEIGVKLDAPHQKDSFRFGQRVSHRPLGNQD